MNDVREEFVNIIHDELGACPDRSQVMSVPSLEQGWQHGVPASTAKQMMTIPDDLSWWFIEAFAPEDYPMAQKVFNAVPPFFFDLAKLEYVATGKPGRVDWNLIYYLRRRLLQAVWPSAYQVATGATKGPALRASKLISQLQTEEQWRQKF